MSRGYLLFFVAASTALALAFFLGSSLQPQQPNFAGDSGYQVQAATYRAGGSECAPANIGSLAEPLRQRKANACAEAQERHRATSNSLVAARRSTIAAEANAYYSFVQARIAAYGAAIGLLTLLAAVAAAVFAERASFHTKAGTNAYKARESAQMVPALIATPYVVEGKAKKRFDPFAYVGASFGDCFS